MTKLRIAKKMKTIPPRKKKLKSPLSSSLLAGTNDSEFGLMIGKVTKKMWEPVVTCQTSILQTTRLKRPTVMTLWLQPTTMKTTWSSRVDMMARFLLGTLKLDLLSFICTNKILPALLTSTFFMRSLWTPSSSCKRKESLFLALLTKHCAFGT